MIYIVEAPAHWYLKGTTWTSDSNRATPFKTREAAEAGIKVAAKFSKPSVVKTWRVVELESWPAP